MRLLRLAPLPFVLGILVAATSAGHAAAPPTAQSCVQARGEARYLGFAYDHWVHLTNRCDRPVTCQVVTDRNPDPVDADVAAQATLSVLTYRASTTAVFTFKMQCEFGGTE